MQVWENALPIDGWNRTKDGLPEIGAEVEIMHFGNSPDDRIIDTATVDRWGIRPHAKDGGHGKRSTVTHWRNLPQQTQNALLSRPAAPGVGENDTAPTAGSA